VLCHVIVLPNKEREIKLSALINRNYKRTAMNIKNICAAGLMVATSFTANTAFAEGNGGNYYVQLGGGASFGLKPGNDMLNKEMGKSGLISAEVGYKIDDNIRIGLGVDYRTGYKFTPADDREPYEDAPGVDRIDRSQFKTKSVSAMVNLYYDFNAGGTVMPYVTVGAGISGNTAKCHGETTLVLASTGEKLTEQSEITRSKSHYAFAYKAGLGAQVALSQNIKFDTRYQFTNLGQAKTGTTPNLESQKGKMKAHEILFGFSFQF
jgi:opacity protein-like surface antigen